MSSEEISEVLELASRLDIEKIDTTDQLRYSLAMCKFAEAVRPIVLKYLNKSQGKSTFLFKM